MAFFLSGGRRKVQIANRFGRCPAGRYSLLSLPAGMTCIPYADTEKDRKVLNTNKKNETAIHRCAERQTTTQTGLELNLCGCYSLPVLKFSCCAPLCTLTTDCCSPAAGCCPQCHQRPTCASQNVRHVCPTRRLDYSTSFPA
ncbi:unnamed protein product, partial [Ectocarpus sp. 13 AM-2016]